MSEIEYQSLSSKHGEINGYFKYTMNKKIEETFSLNNWNEISKEYNKRYTKKSMEMSFFRNNLDIFNKLEDHNCAIWLNISGDLCYRFSINGDVIISSWKKVELVFRNFLQLNVEIKKYDFSQENKSAFITPENKQKLKYEIFIEKLIVIQKEAFDPTVKKEFFEISGLFYKNTFKPTNFLNNFIYNYTPKYSTILSYIYHLANYDINRLNYIINWLANMFNNLTKSNIALILIGNDKSNKNILFNDIIKPLFGAQYCIEIDDDDLENKHFDKLFSEKLFYNFNEISYNVVDKRIKNICRNIIENNSIFIEENHKSSFSEINIFAQTLITTSKSYIPIIDLDRENYTIFNIKGDIKNMIDKDENLYINIKNDLDNFSLFLKSYKVDVSLANKSFKEDDKNIILDYNKNIYEIFIEAIINKDKNYFNKLNVNSKLYKELLYDFDRNRIKRVNLIKYFSLIYPEEPIVHTRTLLNKLREKNSQLFNINNIISSNSEQFFNIL